MFDTERWVSVNEVTNYLGVTRDTLYRWIKEKEFPAHKIGRVYKAKLSDIDGWVKNIDASKIEVDDK